jgi:predicted kinase
MKHLNNYFSFNENSKNDAIPEIGRSKKLAIILLGAPGVGKSTFASNYITNKDRTIKTFSTDDISLTLTKDPKKYRAGSSELNLRKLEIYIKTGRSFIYDTTGTQKENVRNITELSRKSGYTIIYINLIGTLDLSIKQNLQRDRNVPIDYVQKSYDSQFGNMRFFSDLKPDNYYIVYNLDGKYKFMKYESDGLMKRKVDKYVHLKESVNDFGIKDIFYNMIDIDDAGYGIKFTDIKNYTISSNDIHNNTQVLNNFELSKVFNNKKKSRFSISISPINKNIDFNNFASIIDMISVSVERLKEEGWILTGFKSPIVNSVDGILMSIITFNFSKPSIDIDDEVGSNLITKSDIVNAFDKFYITVNQNDISLYDDRFNVDEIYITDDNGYDTVISNGVLNSIKDELFLSDWDKLSNFSVDFYY